MKRTLIFIVALSFLVVSLAVVRDASAWDLLWYGQSSFKVTTPGGKVILIDPFISGNPKTPERLKDLSKLGNVDLILLTHGHGDHIGDTSKIAEMTKAKVGVNADMGHTLGILEIVPYEQLIRFNKSGPISPLKDITITMVHAEHSSEIVHTDPVTKKKMVYPGGEPGGYIIKLENGYTVYFAGDTGVFGDMKFIGEFYKPDLSILPIGGHFTMDPAHAAYAVKNLLKSKLIVPVHYGTFGPLKGTPDELKKALGDFPAKVVVMQPGDTRSF